MFCFSQAGGYSVAGTDVDVTSQAPAVVEVFAVPNKFGAQAGDAGFRIKPIVIPLVVNDVTPGSAAATQGLKVGDVVVSIDGVTLQGVSELIKRFAALKGLVRIESKYERPVQ